MKTLQITSLPAKDVIYDLAAGFETDCVQSCDDYLLAVPESFGNGYIKAIDFKNGMGMLFFECRFSADIELHFIKDGVHPLKFLYCLEGQLKHRFAGEEHVHQISEYQSYIVSNKGNKGHILRFLKDTDVSFISLKINRDEFNPRFQCYIDGAPKEIQLIFKRSIEKSFYYQGPFTVEIWNLFQRIKKNSLKPLARRLYMEAFSYNLMFIQLLQYHDDQQNEDDKIFLRQFEVEAIHKASLLIQTQMERLKSVIDLSREVGLNQNKLQSGFQKLFGNSVNEYIHKERMKKAMYLLHNTDFNMQEIMERIGLNSQSYFSKIFKEAYGYSPSEFRRMQKNP